jgi:hypothetical protein
MQQQWRKSRSTVQLFVSNWFNFWNADCCRVSCSLLLYLFEYYHRTSHSHCLENAYLWHLHFFTCHVVSLTPLRRQNNESYPFYMSWKFIAVSSERGARVTAQIFSSVESGYLSWYSDWRVQGFDFYVLQILLSGSRAYRANCSVGTGVLSQG